MDIEIINVFDNNWLKILHHLSHDIYHLPEYLSAEAKRTNTIPEAIVIAEDDKLFCLPYLLRQCNNLFAEYLNYPEVFDLVSPNGYAGILLNDNARISPDFLNNAMDELISFVRKRNICSAFIRLHPILNHGFQERLSSQICCITGETISVDLTLSETEIWQQTRPEHRTHINRCKRAGFTARITSLKEHIDDFVLIYHQTMERVQAKGYFYFEHEYFQEISRLNENIHLCIVEIENQIACAGIFTECCKIVQYHLGGTNSNFLKQAPSKLMFDYVRFWAKKRGNKFLHLGGGVGSAKDSLYHFKSGFSQQKHHFLTLRLIIDDEKYWDLVAKRAEYLKVEPAQLMQSNYFPAYRHSN